MMAKLSGTTNKVGEILVMDPATYTVYKTHEVSLGAWEVTGLSSSDKMVLAISNAGEIRGHKIVTPELEGSDYVVFGSSYTPDFSYDGNISFTADSAQLSNTSSVHGGYGYIRTTDNNQVSVIDRSNIASTSITTSIPSNTNIYGLVSFDGRANWKYYNGSSWVSIGSDYYTAWPKLTYADQSVEKRFSIGWSYSTTLLPVNRVIYFEAKMTSSHDGYLAIANQTGSDYTMIRQFNGVLEGGVTGYTFGQLVPNDRIGWLIDPVHNTLRVNKNGVWGPTQARNFSAWTSIRAAVNNQSGYDFFSTVYYGAGGAFLDNTYIKPWSTISQLNAGLTNYTITNETSLDFAFLLRTINNTATPSIDLVTINYD